MSRSKKILLGILTLLPVLCIGLYIFFFFSFFFDIAGGNEPEISEVFPAKFRFLFLMIITALVSGFAMMIYYIIHVNKSDMKSDNKLIWILILVLASGLGNIAYYLVEILGIGKNKKSDSNNERRD